MKLATTLIWCAFGLGFPQIGHSTIAVVYLANDELVVAADSRQGLGGGYTDSACKIVAIEKRVVFVSSGMTGFNGSGGLSSWNNDGEARRAYDDVVSKSNGDPKGHLIEIAENFGEGISARFNNLAALAPQLFSRAIAGGNLLTIGLFGGLDPSGKPQLVQVNVNANPGVRPVAPEVFDVRSCPLEGFCAIGEEVPIVVEFARQTSERARQEARTWRPDDAGQSSTPPNVQRAVRLVELATIYQAGGSVGGPVDALALNRNGPAKWYRNKPNCAAN